MRQNNSILSKELDNLMEESFSIIDNAFESSLK